MRISVQWQALSGAFRAAFGACSCADQKTRRAAIAGRSSPHLVGGSDPAADFRRTRYQSDRAALAANAGNVLAGLVHLHGLRELGQLDLTGTQVTLRGIAELRRAFLERVGRQLHISAGHLVATPASSHHRENADH
jgi:hypothetical protein